MTFTNHNSDDILNKWANMNDETYSSGGRERRLGDGRAFAGEHGFVDNAVAGNEDGVDENLAAAFGNLQHVARHQVVEGNLLEDQLPGGVSPTTHARSAWRGWYGISAPGWGRRTG